MAGMSEVYEALRKADSAGDTESAKRLSDYIRSNPFKAERTNSLGVPGDVVSPEEDKPESFMDKLQGGQQVLSSLITGTVGDVAGKVAGVGKEILTGDFGKGTAEKTAENVSEKIAGSGPSSQAGRRYAKNLSDLIAPLQALGPNEFGAIGDIKARLPAAATRVAESPVGKVAAKSGGVAGDAYAKVADKIGDSKFSNGFRNLVENGLVESGPVKAVGKGVDLLTGKAQSEAEESATKGINRILSSASEQSEANVRGALKQEARAKAESSRIEALTRGKTPPPTIQGIGEQSRSAFEEAIDSSMKHQQEVGGRVYQAADEFAAKKEAESGPPPIHEAEDYIRKMKEEAGHIPQISALIKGMESAVLPDAKAGIESIRYNPATFAVEEIPVEETLIKKDYKQLRLTVRWLKDVADKGDLAGWDAVSKRYASQLAHKIEGALDEWNPLNKEARTAYGKAAQASDSATAALGKAILGTEGGFNEDAFYKVAPEKIPQRIFENSNNYNIFIEALAGGKGASPEALARATEIADSLGVQYFAAKFFPEAEGGAGWGGKVMAGIQNPRVAIPSRIKGKLSSEFGDLLKMEKTAADLAETGKAWEKNSAELIKKQNDVKALMSDGMLDLNAKSEAVRAEGVRKLSRALDKAKEAGFIDEEQSKIAHQLIDNKQYSKEKGRIAQRIGTVLSYMVGGYAGGRAVGTMMH